MANNTQDCLYPSLPLPVSGRSWEEIGGYKTVLALAMLGAGAAALFICARWSIALVGAVAVLALSAMESEPFLLLVIFLMPLGWLLPVNMPGRNVPVALRLLVIAGFFAGRLLRGKARLGEVLRPAVSRASLLFFCAAAVPVVLRKGELTPESTRYLYALATYVGFYFVVLAWADSPGRIRRILSVLLYSTVITALFAFLQVAMGGFTSFWLCLNPPGEYPATWEGRAASFLNWPNSLAGYLNLVLPFALASCVLGTGKWKKLGGWTFGLGFVALLSTQSIGGLLAFVAILVLAIFCFVQSRKKRVALLAGLCALACLFYLLRPILNPVHTEQLVESDAATRLLIWGTAWDYFMHSPVMGVGWGNFLGLYGFDLPSLPPRILAAHDIYLQLLAETGLVGFVAFFYLVVQTWRQAWSQLRSSVDLLDRALAFGVLGALLSVLVHGFVDFLFQVSPQFGTLFWAFLAVLVANGASQTSRRGHRGLIIAA